MNKWSGFTVHTEDLSSVEPITISEAKSYARIDSSTEDELILTLIKSARQLCEGYLNKSIIRKTITLTSFDYPNQFILPNAPLLSLDDITKIVSIDENGVETNLIYIAIDGLFPKIQILEQVYQSKFQAVYDAGFLTVPDEIKLAIKIIVNMMYERRESIPMTELPKNIDFLVSNYKDLNWFV